MVDKLTRYDSLFQYYGQVYGLDWSLLKKQAVIESGLNPDAVSSVGASGLTQFMPTTWTEIAVKQAWPAWATPHNPEYSIKAQCIYMHWLLAFFKGNYRLALAGYNWGQGNVQKHPEEPSWPQETRKYVAAVLSPQE